MPGALPSVRSAYSSGDEKGRPWNASRIPSPTPSRALCLLFRRRSSRAVFLSPPCPPRASVGEVSVQQWRREGPSVEQPSSKYNLTPTHVRVGPGEGSGGGAPGERRTRSLRGPRRERSGGFPEVFRRLSGGFPEVFRRRSGGPFLLASANVRDDFGPPENGCTPLGVI